MVQINIIQSLSFSGTTWLHSVMGAHPRVFNLGSSDRPLDVRNKEKILGFRDADWSNMCAIHGTECVFWPKFESAYDCEGNFFLQLASVADVDHVVIANPLPSITGPHLADTNVTVRRINWIRDLRAVGFSFLKHQGAVTFLDAVLDFLVPAMKAVPTPAETAEQFSYRYEDAMRNRKECMEKIGHYVGLRYSDKSLRFWEFDHHLTSGNMSVFQLIRYGQGLAVQDWDNREFYEAQFRRALNSTDGQILDERWRKGLSRLDLYMFDVMCGARNADYGYERDDFSDSERREFEDRLNQLLDHRGQPAPAR